MAQEKITCSDAEKLRHWLDYAVPRGDYNKIKRKLVEECMVPTYTFRNWIYGRCRIPWGAKRDINRVTKEYSGEEIFTIVEPGEIALGVRG